MKKIGVIIFIIIIVAIGFMVFNSQHKTDAEKLLSCNTDAGKVYDSDKQTITKNTMGYTSDMQAQYLKRSSDTYAANLDNCQQQYGN